MMDNKTENSSTTTPTNTNTNNENTKDQQSNQDKSSSKEHALKGANATTIMHALKGANATTIMHALKGANATTITNNRGIVQRLDAPSKSNGGNMIFEPDYKVIDTIDEGGQVLTNVEVILCFWGKSWSKSPAPSPSSEEYKTAIEGIITGPYMNGLRQYHNVGQGTLIYSRINDIIYPKNGYTNDDVVKMLKDMLDNTNMPPPTIFHNRFYAVILPPGIKNQNPNYAGEHQSFMYKGVRGYYAWVGNSGSLTGHDCVTKVFSHELVEACTNPNVDFSTNSIVVEGINANGNRVNDEIGDTCNDKFAPVDVNGILCSVTKKTTGVKTITGVSCQWNNEILVGYSLNHSFF